MAAAKPRPYRRILTSALHRRFVHASALSILVCYLISIFIGDKSSFFWAIFPIGGCGIRTVLLFISSLSVFVLRVGQMHIGSRTTGSAIHTFKHLFPLHVLQTFAWYLFSAWWFSEIYKWSASTSAHLEWIKRGSPHERASLNERPIYVYTYHLLLAIAQSVAHLYLDYDRVPIPLTEQAAGPDQKTHPTETVSKRIQAELPRLLRDGLLRSATVAMVCPVVYTFFLRRRAWSYAMSFAKLFWDFPRSAADPPGLIPPVNPLLITRTLFSGGLLVLLWQTTNLFFSIFLSKEPLKRGQPLTAEVKDPNGSLLNGLKAKKETVRSFAFWELFFISHQFPDRRRAIFNDIEREGGSAWTQILEASTEVIKAISTRIAESKPPSSNPKPSLTKKEEPVLHTLPRLTDSPKADNIFASSPKPTTTQGKLGEGFSKTLRSLGESPDWTPKARARARDAFDRASSIVLSPERKQRLLGSQDLKLLTGASPTKPENLHPLITRLLRSPAGHFLRQTYARRLSGIVLGTPTSSLSSIIDSIESLTRLLIASLQEDPYGKVQADVPGVVRLFTETATTLGKFAHGELEVHWTDANFPPSSNPAAQAEARRVPDVELVIDTLKGSLKSLLSAFKPYLKDIGLVGKDLRLAKEVAGVVEE
ncbi:Putative Nuclear pore complex protein An-Ndc1 (Eurofung) [Aspergillus calidoustus]|uniref:Putative Nuclear pore complex protein An-Ndc1 (Eurofung) n=1 Tax=Aspergillus calidoustus TaxID=454130 RepID=A0A0U5FVC1_ASPCI|nr:Putative Nuclear pore complex protein An-Ndc1 (Eurofung) [Aspergillus calidoustus]